MRPPPAHAALANLAARQHGVVSVGQLRALGLGPRGAQHRAALHRLRRVHRGVYAVSPNRLSPDGVLMAAVLACGTGGHVNEQSAASLWGFRKSTSGPVHILLPGSSRRGPPGVHVHRTRHLDPRDRAEVRGIPVTSVALTLVDLAETLDDASLARSVHEAEVLRLFDKREFDRFNGRRGAHRLLTLLADPEATASQGEFDDHFRALCRAHSLPLPQMHVHLPAGSRLVEVDALWRQAKVCVELDGGQVHRTRRAFSRDRERDLALAAEGYLTVRLTWSHVTQQATRVAADLHRLLNNRCPPASHSPSSQSA